MRSTIAVRRDFAVGALRMLPRDTKGPNPEPVPHSQSLASRQADSSATSRKASSPSTTATVRLVSSHLSKLEQNATPHPPHVTASIASTSPSFFGSLILFPSPKVMHHAASVSPFCQKISLLHPHILTLTPAGTRPKPLSISPGIQTRIVRTKAASTPLAGDLKVQRRAFLRDTVLVAAAGLLIAAMAETTTSPAAAGAPPTSSLERLPYKEDGYNFWTWRGHKVHYVVEGQGRPVVLIHGFGASAYHWRYNIPELAKTHTVYAMDLLGFGWSEKALIEYDANVWRDQVADFVRDVVGKPAVLAGNSIGGFTVLSTAASYPDLVSGVALLNASGQFESSDPAQKMGDETPEKGVVELQESLFRRVILTPIQNTVQKYGILFAFWQAKQPARIKSVLQNVYKDQTNVDDYLVQSIVQPTGDPNAGEVYYRLMTQVLFKRSNQTINKLVSQLSCPMLLLWGDLDPWIGPSKCGQLKALYPRASTVHLQAGHCPHDEVPEQANKALLDFANSVYSE